MRGLNSLALTESRATCMRKLSRNSSGYSTHEVKWQALQPKGALQLAMRALGSRHSRINMADLCMDSEFKPRELNALKPQIKKGP